MSGIAGHANPGAQSRSAHNAQPLPAACVELLTKNPELALSLAAHQRADAFDEAFTAAMRARGIAHADEACDRPSSRRASIVLPRWPACERRGWHPIALEWGAQGVEFVWACGETVDAPFHEQQVADLRCRPFNRMLRVVTPLSEDFAADLAENALPLKGAIFHMSRCGSTLVSQALKAWRGLRVVSESAVLDTAIFLAISGHDPSFLALRAAVAALAQRNEVDDGIVFKLDAWHALVIERLIPVLGAPWLFVYRSPVEILASHRRQPGRHTVPGMLPDAWLPAAARAGALELEQHAACVLGATCAAVARHARRDNLINYEELPRAIETRVAPHFGLDRSAFDGARFAALTAQDAKRPHEKFVADREAKRAVADRSMYENIGRWMDAPYRALEEIRTVLRRLRLPLRCDLEALRADLAATAPAGWQPHFNTQYYRGDWSGIALRAQAHGRSSLYADPSCAEFADTEAMQACRYVPQFLAQFACELESVRFLKLAPGAEILEHRDPGLRFEDGGVRFHVPVYTDANVEFVLGGETLLLAEGECWYLNFDLPHTVTNRGARDRVHLVIDARVNDWVTGLFGQLRAD